MKWFFVLAVLAALISGSVFSGGARATVMNGTGVPCSDGGKCKGINSPSYGRSNSTCTSLKSICLRINSGSGQCAVAHSNSMATGVFAGPRGTISNVDRR